MNIREISKPLRVKCRVFCRHDLALNVAVTLTPPYISLVVLYTKHAGGFDNNFNVLA
jgi:hypothetical protein